MERQETALGSFKRLLENLKYQGYAIVKKNDQSDDLSIAPRDLLPLQFFLHFACAVYTLQLELESAPETERLSHLLKTSELEACLLQDFEQAFPGQRGLLQGRFDTVGKRKRIEKFVFEDYEWVPETDGLGSEGDDKSGSGSGESAEGGQGRPWTDEFEKGMDVVVGPLGEEDRGDVEQVPGQDQAVDTESDSEAYEDDSDTDEDDSEIDEYTPNRKRKAGGRKEKQGPAKRRRH